VRAKACFSHAIGWPSRDVKRGGRTRPRDRAGAWPEAERGVVTLIYRVGPGPPSVSTRAASSWTASAAKSARREFGSLPTQVPHRRTKRTLAQFDDPQHKNALLEHILTERDVDVTTQSTDGELEHALGRVDLRELAWPQCKSTGDIHDHLRRSTEFH